MGILLHVNGVVYMKQKNYRRETAFLYPELEKCAFEQKLHTLGLITQITAIVTAANNQLVELIEGGTFSFINCMPSVHMECISDISSNFLNYENVRICVVRFDEYDYTENYQKLLQEYKSGQTGISHLVALNITSRQQKALFLEDQQGQFDSVISTSLDHLESILVSIMFDIAMYHYFGLSNDLPFRKRFNKLKFEYLTHKYDKKWQSDNYGSAFPEKNIYLPVSLPEVRKLDRRAKLESRQKAVKEMLDSFATFLAESSLAIQVIKDSDGDFRGLHSDIPEDLEPEVENTIHERNDEKKFSIIFFKNSTEKVSGKVVRCFKEGRLSCWVEKSTENDSLYKIITVEHGGDRL